MDRRGSYFFVIDAFVAAIIISGTIVVLLNEFVVRPSEKESFYTAEDVLVLLESTQVRDFGPEIVRDWVANGTIPDGTVSVLQQMALFNSTGNRSYALALANFSLEGVPPQVSARIMIGGEVYAERMLADDQDADVFFTSNRIVVLRESKTRLFPPVVIEVQTWQ